LFANVDDPDLQDYNPIQMSYFIYKHFHATIDFFRTFSPSAPPTPWSIQWRLLLFQPFLLLTSLITHLPYLLRPKPYTQIWIPTRSGHVRALLYQPRAPSTPLPQNQKLRPIHLDLHGGAFIGGHPEASTRFCRLLSTQLSTIVIAATYRIAPYHVFPAAIDDVDDIITWLHAHASSLGGDSNCLTLSGSSAGGNLAFGACMGEGCALPSDTAIKGIVTFYAALNLSIPPWDKPKSGNFPKSDPFAVFLRLYDAYPRLARDTEGKNPRLSPANLPVERVPCDVLLVVAGIDILVEEQCRFVERVKREGRERGLERRIEAVVFEEGFHGWLERELKPVVAMMAELLT
jgi:acetyl esterase/lipase